MLRAQDETLPDKLLAQIAPLRLGPNQLQWRLRLAAPTAQTEGFGPAKSVLRVPRCRPPQKYACLINSSADQFLGQLAGPQRSALVHLVRILACKRSPADWHARSVMVDNEFLS